MNTENKIIFSIIGILFIVGNIFIVISLASKNHDINSPSYQKDFNKNQNLFKTGALFVVIAMLLGIAKIFSR